MKIIGKAEDGKYLLTATKDEVFELLGVSNLSYKEDKDLNHDQLIFKRAIVGQYTDIIGLDIVVHDMYKAAKSLADGWQNSRNVSVSASTLRTMANELENIAKVYNLPKQH